MLLKDRNTLLVVLARFVSRVGGTAAFFIGVWGMAAYTFDATARTLAWVMAGNSIAGIAGSMAAGVFIDRFGPRRVLIGAELLTVPAAIALAFAPTFAVFVPLTWLFGLVATPTFTAGAAFAPYLVRGHGGLERTNALIEGTGSLAFILGPAIGAVLAKTGGPRSVFIGTAVASLVAIGFAWFVRIDESRRARGQERHPLRELKDGMKTSYSTPSLRFYILGGTVMWFGFGAFSALEPLFYRDVVKASVEWIGWMNSAFGGGLVVGAALMPRLPRRVFSARGLTALVGLTGVGAVLYVGSTDLKLIACGAIAWGLIIGATEPLLRTLLHRASPVGYVGRITGTAQYHRNAGELVPLAIAPTLAVVFGVQPTLIAGGLVVTLVALAAFPLAHSVDRESRLTPAPDVVPESAHATVGLGDEIL